MSRIRASILLPLPVVAVTCRGAVPLCALSYPHAYAEKQGTLPPGAFVSSLTAVAPGLYSMYGGERRRGEKRLEHVLKRKRVSPERLPQLILDQVLAFSQGTPRDDVAVLALSLREIVGTGSAPPFKQEKLLD